MNILVLLIPISLILGGAALIAFIWSLRSGQYDDPKGNSSRIFLDDQIEPD
jgi:cbb3-type cytochrome oxidase maturation protein